MIEIKHLFRYPVKGLSAEPVDWLPISCRDGVPHDRSYALALGTTHFSPDAPEPLDKGHFLMLRANESLAALRTGFDQAAGMLTVSQRGECMVRGDLSTAEGRDAVETFFTGYVGTAAKGRVRLVSAPGHKFTDVSVVSPAMMRAVSLINLATVRALQDVVQTEIHPLRFRANIYLDGLEPWEELNWVGRDIRFGDVTLRAVQATRRCAAIDVNPVTAERDTTLPKAIMRHTGHTNLGIYLEVAQDGALRHGEAVTLVA